MTTDDILAEYPGSTIVQLYHPFKPSVRFERWEGRNTFYCEPPSDWRMKFGHEDYKPIYRRKMGRTVV